MSNNPFFRIEQDRALMDRSLEYLRDKSRDLRFIHVREMFQQAKEIHVAQKASYFSIKKESVRLSSMLRESE